MKGERSWEAPAERQETLWEKLRRVKNRGGSTTPVASFWRRNEIGKSGDFLISTTSAQVQDGRILRLISSRKLAAAFWELHHYKLPLDNMHHVVTAPPHRIRRLNRQNHHRQDPPPSSHDLIAPYNPAVARSSSIELKGTSVEASYCLRTSTELLKLLNRVWSLEEQHISNMSLIKALKKELDSARSQTKELDREQQADRREMNELIKHIREDKLVRENKEHDRINAKVESIRDELEKERKLRLRMECLHRKLARELYEVKTSLASISKELERERKSRDLLEDLCDEFAWGIRDYENELHDLRHKSSKDFWGNRADHEQSILHVSESWLDERIQAKLQHAHGVGEKKSTIGKLSSEIEAFLQSKSNSKVNIDSNKVARNPIFQRSSLESIPLNVGASAPQDDEDEDDTIGSDSNCFEMQNTSESNPKSQGKKFLENRYEEILKQKQLKTREQSSSSLQVKCDEHTAQSMSHEVRRNEVEDAEQIETGQGNPDEIRISQKARVFEAAKEDISEQNRECEGITRLGSNYLIHNLIRNPYSLSESGMQSNQDYALASSIWRSYPSPVREWTEKLPPNLKENTLKLRLSEARTNGQRSRSRRKASIVPSRDE